MSIVNIPVIETRRLILRGPEPEDYPDFKATFTSYRARFMGGPLNPYESLDALRRRNRPLGRSAVTACG